MQKRPGARPWTITPEELGIDEAAQLTGLGGRQVVDLAQPGVRRDRSRPERLLASIGKQRPDATPGPSAEAGQKRQLGTPPAPASEMIRRQSGIRCLKEDGVATLARQPAARADLGQTPHGRGLIGGVGPLQGRARAVRRRNQVVEAQGVFSKRLNLKSQIMPLRHRHRVGAFIPLGGLGPVVNPGKIDPGTRRRGGDDSGIEAAGDLTDHPVMSPQKPRGRLTDDPAERLWIVVPGSAPTDAGGRPDDFAFDRPASSHNGPGQDGRDPEERGCDGRLLRRLHHDGQRLFIYGEVRRQELNHLFRDAVGDDRHPVPAPRQNVETSGRIAHPPEVGVVPVPKRQARPPALGEETAGEPRVRPRPADDVADRPIAHPAADAHMGAMDLDRLQPAGQQDLERTKPMGGSPAAPQQSRSITIPEGLGPFSDARRQIAGRAHRTIKGVKATRRSTWSFRAVSPSCTQQWASKGHSRTPKTQSAPCPRRRRYAMSKADRARQRPSKGSQGRMLQRSSARRKVSASRCPWPVGPATARSGVSPGLRRARRTSALAPSAACQLRTETRRAGAPSTRLCRGRAIGGASAVAAALTSRP